MDISKLTKEQIEIIQAKIDRAVKSGIAKKQTKEEMLLDFKKRLGLVWIIEVLWHKIFLFLNISNHNGKSPDFLPTDFPLWFD